MHDMGTTCHFFEKTTHIFNSVVLWFRFVASNPLSLSAYPTYVHYIYMYMFTQMQTHTHMDMYIYIYVCTTLSACKTHTFTK